MENEVRQPLRRLDVTEHVELFHADHLGFDDIRSTVAQWWDLDELAAGYEHFLSEYRPMLMRWPRVRTFRGRHAGAFADYLRAIDA